MLVATYGSLRKGLQHHYLLEDKSVKYMGTFETTPKYTMKDLGDYPGLLKNGHSSIIMEVYRVTDPVINKINILEGYTDENNPVNLYNKEEIITPYGKSYVYFYADPDETHGFPTCIAGDWKDYMLQKKLTHNE